MEPIVSIILLGNKHCGKSTVGKILSESLGIPFFDLDDLIFKEIPPRYTSLREFCKEEKMVAFRKIELETVKKFCQDPINNSHPYILALGGGTAEEPQSVSLLKKGGEFIYLKAEFETLYHRIEKGGIPPFLNQENPRESFQHLFEKRSRLYQTIADITIDTSKQSPDEVAMTIKATISKKLQQTKNEKTAETHINKRTNQ